MKPHVEEIASVSERQLFDCLAGTIGFCYLDSADETSKWSRVSVMGGFPFRSYEFKDGSVYQEFGSDKPSVGQDIWEVLQAELAAFSTFICPDVGPFPFYGGAMGYFSYEMAGDLGYHVHPSDSLLPDCRVGLYHIVIVLDHIEDKKWYIEWPLSENIGAKQFGSFAAFWSSFSDATGIGTCAIGHPVLSQTKAEYMHHVGRAKWHITQGDIYQVNLSARFSASFEGSSAALYSIFREESPAPFGAFLHYSDAAIYSASPERFFSIRDGVIQTRPIKGTMPRGESPSQDLYNRDSLWNSEKNRAELLMIVDLERHDLGRVCEYGSVTVPELLVLESYAQVHHLVATIEGRLKKTVGAVDALKSLFPGGSITGAPKLRATEIAVALETVPRSVYTGAIGYIGFDGNCDFNIAIRTMYSCQNYLYFHAGCGIVADSDPESEYGELLAKAKGFFQTLGRTALCIPGL